jgi:hypothetical protein
VHGAGEYIEQIIHVEGWKTRGPGPHLAIVVAVSVSFHVTQQIVGRLGREENEQKAVKREAKDHFEPGNVLAVLDGSHTEGLFTLLNVSFDE